MNFEHIQNYYNVLFQMIFEMRSKNSSCFNRTPSHSVGEKNRTSKPLISEVSSKETEPQKSK